MFVKPFHNCPPYYRPGEGPYRVVAVIESIKSQTKRDLNYEKDLAEQMIKLNGKIPLIDKQNKKINNL